MRLIVLIFLWFSNLSLYAQQNYFVYPPVLGEVSAANLNSDTLFRRLDCHIKDSLFDTYFIHSGVFDDSTIVGWVIVRSWWQEDNIKDSISIFGESHAVKLSPLDCGSETYVEPITNNNISDEIKVAGVYARSRPILIVNTHTCKFLFMENKSLFQAHTDR